MKRTWANRHLGAMCGLLVAQQLAVATSTPLLAAIARDAAGASLRTPLVAAYLLSVLLPYLPGGLSLVAQRRWELAMQATFLARASGFLYGRTELWAARDARDRYTGLLAKDGFTILKELSTWAYGTFASALNALLSIVALAIVVEPLFLAGYGTSLVLAAVLLRLQSPRNRRLAAEAGNRRVTLSSVLLRVWDNTTLGNRSAFACWRGDRDARFAEAQDASLREVRFATSVSIAIALTTLLPTLLVLAYAVRVHRHDAGYLVALVVTLPRLFQLLNTSHTLLSYVFEWSAQRGRLALLDEFFAPPPPQDLEGRVRFDRIRTEALHGPLSLAALEEAIRIPQRITLRGPNGSGKSTLLLLLKARLGDRAFYLPAQHRLALAVTDAPRSTGEHASDALEALRRDAGAEVLLLDEWDANLDAAHRERLSRLIDEIAESRPVVEVRHGSGPGCAV